MWQVIGVVLILSFMLTPAILIWFVFRSCPLCNRKNEECTCPDHVHHSAISEDYL